MRQSRVFVGPIEIAGYFGRLTEGLQEIGIEAHWVPQSDHTFGYRYKLENRESTSLIQSLLSRSARLRQSSSRIMRLLAEMSALPVLIIALFRYKVFIFSAGKSLLSRNRDLPVLRFFRKRLIGVMGLGSEARPTYINGAAIGPPGTRMAAATQVRVARRVAQTVRRWEKWAHVIVGSPLSTSQFSSIRFVNHYALGLPVSAAERKPEMLSSTRHGELVTALHSPSSPHSKGTRIIKEVVNRLKNEGVQIELKILHGVQNQEVLEAIEGCDFILDQVYSDTPMATFASEGAARAKPSVVSGYGLQYLKNFVEDSMWPPALTAMPDELMQVVRRIATDHDLRRELGRASQVFVSGEWNHRRVAERFALLIEDSIPDDWWIDPREVDYLQGYGLNEREAKENISAVLNLGGAEALSLGHNPALRDKFINWANEP